MALACDATLAKSKAQLASKGLDDWTLQVLTAYSQQIKSEEYTDAEQNLLLTFSDIANAQATVRSAVSMDFVSHSNLHCQIAAIGIIIQDDDLTKHSMGNLFRCGEKLASGLSRIPDHIPLLPDAPLPAHKAHILARSRLHQIKSAHILALESLQTLQTARSLATTSPPKQPNLFSLGDTNSLSNSRPKPCRN